MAEPRMISHHWVDWKSDPIFAISGPKYTCSCQFVWCRFSLKCHFLICDILLGIFEINI